MKSISGMLGSQRGYGISSLSVSLPLQTFNPHLFKKYPQNTKIDWMNNLTSDKAYDTIGEESAVLNVLRSNHALPPLVDFVDSYRIPARSNSLVSFNGGFKIGETFPGIFGGDRDNRVSEVEMLGRLSMRGDVKEVIDGMIKCVEDKRRWNRSVDLDLNECGEVLKTMSHLYDEI